MDKYELSIKEDKIRKHAEKKDYVTAAKIADTVDWKRVKNIKMLTLVSQIYEKVKNYAEAKNVLLIAYERVPVGRRMLYKLTELCVKAGKLDEAEEFFEEFQEIAPNDISKLILAYQIEAARGEPLDKLIMILELYRKNEFEEKWAYELAYLYHKAGRVKECVQLCNEIILWFSVGTYVDKALELKMQYEPLTPSQQEKLVNKKKFEERIKAVEREFETKYSQETMDGQREPEEPDLKETAAQEAAMTEEPEMTEEASVDEEAEVIPDILLQDAQLRDMETDLAQAVRAAADEMAQERADDMDSTKEIPVQKKELKEAAEDISQTTEFLNEVSAALAASAFTEEIQEDPVAEYQPETDTKEPEEEEQETVWPEAEPEEEISAEEVSAEEIPAVEMPEEEVPAEALQEEEAAEEISAETISEETPEAEREELDVPDDFIKEVSAAMAASIASVVSEEAKVPEKTAKAPEVQKAPETPKVPEAPRTHEVPKEIPKEENVGKNQITCVVVGEEPGEGRISYAVEMLKKTHEILGVKATQVAKISGTKLNAKGIPATIAKLGGRDLIVDYAADLSSKTVEELVKELKRPSVSMVIVLVDSQERMDMLLMDHPELDKLCVYLEDDGQMSVDDFVACATAYAEEEECIIDEMGGLALYAAAERMRNDGVQLSESEAKTFIDGVIEKAEHRGIKGIFSSKYDKNGYLILQEQYFKN